MKDNHIVIYGDYLINSELTSQIINVSQGVVNSNITVNTKKEIYLEGNKGKIKIDCFGKFFYKSEVEEKTIPFNTVEIFNFEMKHKHSSLAKIVTLSLNIKPVQTLSKSMPAPVSIRLSSTLSSSNKTDGSGVYWRYSELD